MYTHQTLGERHAIAEATRSIPEVLTAQAKVCVERGEFTRAEALYVRAKKPELAVKAYKEAQRWNDASADRASFCRTGWVSCRPSTRRPPRRGPGHGGGGGGGESALAPARALEEGASSRRRSTRT